MEQAGLCTLAHHHSSDRRQEQIKMGMVALPPQLEDRMHEQGEMTTCSLLGYYCKQPLSHFYSYSTLYLTAIHLIKMFLREPNKA